MSDTKTKLLSYLQGKNTIPYISSINDIEELYYFSIYWNFIEWGSNEDQFIIISNNINKLDNQNIDDNNQLDTIFHYFYHRYNQKQYDFNILIKVIEWIPRWVVNHNLYYDILNKHLSKISHEEKKKFVAYIISRFRNRLFHWQKETSVEQNENFKVINTFLHYLLTK